MVDSDPRGGNPWPAPRVPTGTPKSPHPTRRTTGESPVVVGEAHKKKILRTKPTDGVEDWFGEEAATGGLQYLRHRTGTPGRGLITWHLALENQGVKCDI